MASAHDEHVPFLRLQPPMPTFCMCHLDEHACHKLGALHANDAANPQSGRLPQQHTNASLPMTQQFKSATAVVCKFQHTHELHGHLAISSGATNQCNEGHISQFCEYAKVGHWPSTRFFLGELSTKSQPLEAAHSVPVAFADLPTFAAKLCTSYLDQTLQNINVKHGDIPAMRPLIYNFVALADLV